MNLPRKYLALLVPLLLLCGCVRQQLLSDLDQKQAHEVVAVLGGHGIPAYAEKSRSGSKFGVTVEADDYVLAVSILNAKGLPRDSAIGFNELTEAKGLIPNSREAEALRLDHAMSLEIEEKLRVIPGVAEVKVAVRSNIVREEQPASASVLIERLPDHPIDSQQLEKIIELMVPGVTRERIQVMINDVRPRSVRVADSGVENRNGVLVHRPLVPFLRMFRVPVGEHKLLALVFLIFIISTAAIFCIFGFFFGRRAEVARRTRIQVAEGRRANQDMLAGSKGRADSGASQRLLGNFPEG